MIRIVLSVSLFSIAAALPVRAEEKRPPNIIILYADDLAYGDLSCYGHPTIRTPELDKMAAEGVRFTQFYSSASVCTPSRAALLTGRLPIRSGLTRVLGPKSDGGIQPNEVTIADSLKKKGYATACIGKWHLGHLEQYRPLRHGFDRYYGLLYSNDMTPVSLYRDNADIENPIKQETLTERYTAEALRFIDEAKSRPFFLYLPYTMPHVPLSVTSRFAGRSRRGLYGDVVAAIDWSVGQLLSKLRTLGLAENTFVFFSSDNGPWLSQGINSGSAGLLREGKGSAWEGGMREPGIAWWPGRIKSALITPELACTMDLFTTSLTLAGVKLPSGRIIDGVDLSPILLGGKSGRELFFYYVHEDLMAVRKGPWKIHFMTQSEYDEKNRKTHKPPLLYQVEHDPSEKFDLAKEHPEIVTDLMAEAERHKRQLVPGKPQR